MPALDIFRDSFVGQVIYFASGRRLLRYPEECPGYVLPSRYFQPNLPLSDASTACIPSPPAASVRGEDKESEPPPATTSVEAANTLPPDESALAREYLHPHGDVEKSTLAHIGQHSDHNLVDWNGSDDPEAPLNWSTWKKAFFTAQIFLLTVAIYMGGAIFGPGAGDLAQKFGVSEVAATVGITTFVLGYAFGPMILSPISELAYVGRMPIYIVTLAIFVIIQVPTALTTNLGVIIFLRFVAGFIGSPVLATGGASLADIYKPEHVGTLMGLWGVIGTGGPSLGPLLGGYAVEAKGWTWTIWILMWASSLALIILMFSMPETSAQTLLYRRAERLRRLTGNKSLRSQAEFDGQHISIGDLAMTCLIRPVILGTREPIIIAWNLYCSLLYAILYCWIESFGVVFIENHGFTLGENGLAFISLPVGGVIAYVLFLPFINRYLKPKFANGTFTPEDRLPTAMLGGILLPISLFWFGWTSASSIHWISPMAAAALWMVSNYLMFNSGLSYLIDCYPRHVASVMAGNVVMRSTLGAVFPLFSNAFFHHLGVGPACSILGGISGLMLPIPFLLYRYGPKLRSWSKYAN